MKELGLSWCRVFIMPACLRSPWPNLLVIWSSISWSHCSPRVASFACLRQAWPWFTRTQTPVVQTLAWSSPSWESCFLSSQCGLIVRSIQPPRIRVGVPSSLPSLRFSHHGSVTNLWGTFWHQVTYSIQHIVTLLIHGFGTVSDWSNR